MTPRIRNFKAEYERRIARGHELGLTRSQARGHPRHYEPYVSEIAKVSVWDPELEPGLKEIREGESLTEAARSLHVAPERLRSYLAQTAVGRKEAGRWRIGPDFRKRQMLVFSKGRALTLLLPDYEEANHAGAYMAAVGQFLRTNDGSLLAPFVGQGVRDAKGEFHPFEVRPNVLYRLNLTEEASFEEVYKIVA